MSPEKKKKIRVPLRKNRAKKPRERDWTRQFQEHGPEELPEMPLVERVSGKGELTRHRTVIEAEPAGEVVATPGGESAAAAIGADRSACLRGRVLRVHGQWCDVIDSDGRLHQCAVRRLLRTLATEERNIVAAGDRVLFRPAGEGEGMIERVEPRSSVLTRALRDQQHVMVANVDQIVIVASVGDRGLKPSLIDRYLISAEQGHISPVICLNKIDLVDPVDLQPVVGLYTQLGYPVLLTSAIAGIGIDALRDTLRDRETVVAGQSGVGKSSLLNAVQPGLRLAVDAVSHWTQKGKHTTSTAELIALEFGGWVVDTPGIRQFQLWDIIPEEVEGYFVEFRPFVGFCRFPNCSHTHEVGCAVKAAVADGLIESTRYDSYLKILRGEPLEEGTEFEAEE